MPTITSPEPLLTPIRLPSGLLMERKPANDFELWAVTRTMFGLQIPRVRVCHDHCAPFEVFADSYFGREGVIVVKGSRGLSGKSYELAGLGLVTTVLHGCKTNVLGGSAAQSVNVHEHMGHFWSHPNAPRYMLAEEPTKFETKLRNGGRIKALMASNRSVRGPHPARLFLDEIDEMELEILDSAMGMPMDQEVGLAGHETVIPASTLMTSTHQYAAGTMSAILARAREKGWKSVSWCWRESSNPIDGWLNLSLVKAKKRDVSKRMWEIEYELGEPAIEGRAITSEHVVKMFGDRPHNNAQATGLGPTPTGFVVLYEGAAGKEYRFQPVERGVRYVTGVDWAKTTDWTVITTYRLDTWEMVAFQRTNKESWPVMIGKAIRRYRTYPGLLVHDATGLGDVIDDVFPEEMRMSNSILGVKLVGAQRATIFSEYITAIEQDTFKAPYIQWAHDEHLYAVHDDLYRAGTKFHPPDSIVSGALAWWGRSMVPSNAAPIVDVVKEPGEGWFDTPGMANYADMEESFEVNFG